MLRIFLIFGLLAITQAKSVYKQTEELEWNEFKFRFGKNYADNGEEETRKANYFYNKDLVVQHNALKNSTWTASVNEYSDMAFKEFNSIMNGLKAELKKPSSEIYKAKEDFQAPEELDYRKLGYVTDVKNQGQCGSCWAFSSTGSIEGQIFKKKNKLISLSEQNLVDCSHEYGNDGCGGGFMDQAFDYIIDNKGIDTEESYPYEGIDTKCRYKKLNKGAEVNGYINIERENDDALMQALVENGPISVAISLDENFMIYSTGIYDSIECMKYVIGHAVLLVGYGTDEETGKKYWLVKNSWGTSWGEDGYVRMTREIKNFCSISTLPLYPKV